MIHALMFERHQNMTLVAAAGAELPIVATGDTDVTNPEVGAVAEAGTGAGAAAQAEIGVGVVH
jgi:hypothetical protein